jgi:hypothetical protein
MKIDLNEIKDWREFEDLIADFFRKQYLKEDNSIISVFVEPSGKGADGGRDLLVTLKFNDSIVEFQRKWVVQSKFYDKTVAKSHVSDVNIPTLIHEYGADGYILICKGDVSSKLTEMFENLRKNCRFGYQYSVWSGTQFAFEISYNSALANYYFPKSSSQQ